MPEEEEVVGRRKVRRRGKGAINVVVVADGGSGSVDAVKDDKGGVTHKLAAGCWVSLVIMLSPLLLEESSDEVRCSVHKKPSNVRHWVCPS